MCDGEYACFCCPPGQSANLGFKFVGAPEHIDIEKLLNAVTPTEGLVRVDWEVVAQAIETLPALERPAAWGEACQQWLQLLRDDLGGSYAVCESTEFLMLHDLPAPTAASLLDFAEQNVVAIRDRLPGLAWRDNIGKQVIIAFSEEDDYYAYVAWFFDSSSIPSSLGCHLGRGISHVALRFTTPQETAQTLAHELSHDCVAHLPVPLWLNEGVAQRLQRVTAGVYAPRAGHGDGDPVWAAISNWQPPLMWGELAERHHAFWNEENIQSFWAGTSWQSDQESQELSYSLAEVLVHSLGENRDAFLDFLGRAHYDDAGQTAALDCLGVCLGDAAGQFLGEGNWRPLRKAMVDCWKAAKQKSENEPPQAIRIVRPPSMV